MPDQILPITNLGQTGLILDSPPISIPPGAFSDARNVRFRHGAIRKMEGEVNLFPNIFDDQYVNGLATNDSETLKYVAWWPNPNLADNLRGYYLIIAEDGRRGKDVAYICLPGADSERVEKGSFSPAPASAWQHTFFQGGYALIINNGIDAPEYILDVDGNEDINLVPNFAILPGWQSYNVREVAIEDTFTANSERIFDLNRSVNFETQTITVQDVTDESRIIDYIPTTGSTSRLIQGDIDSEFLRGAVGLNNANEPTDSDHFTLYATRFGYRDSTPTIPYTTTENLSIGIGPLSVGRKIRIRIESRVAVEVRAGVVRSFGDFLTAGNLIEIDSEQPVFDTDGRLNPNRILRNLPGVVRTSDVALPGNIPTNWNPFAAGVSTADEFVISDTGIVQDMVELQGNLYLYSNTSISVLRKTGNAQVPFVSQPVTDSYGAQTTGAVLEFDGSHIVIGSEDIYLFGGHPGSIKSISDHRVRTYFFNDLNPLHEDNLFALRYQQKDEVWICYPSTASITGECDKALIWNYRADNWTIRELRNVVSGDVGPVPGGGIPGAFVELNGTSGNNGIDALGTDEIQTIVVDSDISIPSSIQAGTNHITNITIDNIGQNFPSFQSRGPIFHDITIGPDFNSGSGSDQVSPLAFRFSLLQADNTFATGFPVTVILDSDTTRAEDVRNQLIDDSEFNKYYRVITTDTDSSFVVRARAFPGETVVSDDGRFDTYTYPDYASGSVLVNGVILANAQTRAQLQRDSECDIYAPANGRFTSTGTTRSYEFGAFVNPPCISRLYFPDIIAGTNIDSDNITLQVDATMAGDTTRMYEEDGIISTDPMYLTGRGGELARPNRNPGSSDSELNSQDMYQDAFPDTQSVTLPWTPTRSGAHSFRMNVPGTGGNIASYNADDVRLTAYEVPPPAASNNDSTITTRSSNPVDGIEAPAIVFDTGRYVYSNNAFSTVTDHTIRVPLYGNFLNSQLDRADEVALQIRDAINESAPTLWTAQTREIGVNGFVNLVGVSPRRQFVNKVSATAPLTLNKFTIVDSEYGFEPTTSTTAENPRFSITGPGFASAMTYELSPDSDGWNAHGVMTAISTFINLNDNQRWGVDHVGWNYARLRNDENIPITGAWEISLLSPGNTGLVTDSEDVRLVSPRYTFFNPRFLNSRIVRGTQLTGSFDVGGVTITIGTDDSRGAEFTRATPTLFAMRVRNTSVTQGQELILLSENDTNTYDPTNNPIAPGVTNNARSDAVETARNWVNTLRLANRRMNIFYADGSSSFRIVPVNYDDLATFALEIVMNDTQAGADRIQALWDMTQAGTLHLNSYSITQLPQGTGNLTLSRATFAAQQSAESMPPIPNERPTDNFATLANVGPTPTIEFDVDRPWDSTQINPNKEYPIFASTATLDNTLTGLATGVVQSNKIIGADIGWSYPLFSIDSDRNNDSEAYESYVERKQLAFAPEFSTETMRAIVILADGEYKPSLDSPVQRNRLEVRVAGTDYPAEDVDLTDSENYVMNAYNISEDYKLDLRVHGRLLNARVTDKVSEPNPNPTKFNDRTEWNVSGMQLEISEDGRR